MLNVENLTNPFVLGQALGAFAVLAALAAGMATAAKRFLPEKFALAAGFLLAGLIGTCIGAFGFADGGEPAWSESGLIYGAPAAVAALIALLTGLFAARRNGGTGTKQPLYFFAYAGLAAAVIFGSVASQLVDFYSDNERIFSDPLMKGFAAIESRYPERWSELKEELRAAELTGPDRLPAIITSFYSRYQPEFYRLASDEAVTALQKFITRKMDYLSASDPDSCVALLNGTPTGRVADALPYDLKLEEAEHIELLINSSGSASSGTAGAAEAEAVFVAGILQFADQNPEGYLAYASQTEGAPADPAAICSTWVSINRILEARPQDEYARFIRSDIWINPEADLSADAEEQISLGYYHADAAIARRDLPSSVDPTTTLTNIVFEDRAYRYVYELSGALPTRDQLVSFFEVSSVPDICADETLRPILDSDISLKYDYVVGSEQIVLTVDSYVCASGTLRVSEQ
jgi:hypothetical protein